MAAALGRKLVFSQELRDCDRASASAASSARWRTINQRQAYLVEGAEALPNPNGTAPGQWIEHDGRVVMLLPGPPGELKPMFVRRMRAAAGTPPARRR